MAILIPGVGLSDCPDTVLIPSAGIVEQRKYLDINAAGGLSFSGAATVEFYSVEVPAAGNRNSRRLLGGYLRRHNRETSDAVFPTSFLLLNDGTNLLLNDNTNILLNN